MQQNNIQGLTLIELMITMAVLAIITAIAIPAYNGYVTSARNTEGYNNLNAIRLAQEEYFLENGTYFAGTTNAAGAIGSYYTVAEGTNRNFNYTVTGNATTWAATATGRGAGYDVPASVTFSLGK